MLHQVVAKELTLDLHPPLSAQDLRGSMTSLLRSLGENLSVKGIIPGHIKAIVMEEGVFAVFSCTRPGKVTENDSRAWNDFLFSRPRLYLNVVVMGMTKEKVDEEVNRCLEELLRSPQISKK